jgi:DnaJ-class molecular chaperone
VAKQIPCPCKGNPICQLCQGRGVYNYQPGPRGWMPFVCPTCGGKGILEKSGESAEDCPTCHGACNIDPADIPIGIFTKVRKIFFGG